ncbi:hypothetical protein K492DRAFT_164864 [Lichtheimia hyalospora FSU 10163]|nr:hypothetical protein K492DRAFT_164864 [Lichtheimia hyalospora FSU 10163]
MPRNLVINTQVDRNNPRVSDWQPSPTVSTALQSERNSSGHLFKQQNNSMLIEEVEEEEEEDSDDIIEEDDDDEDDLDEADDSEYTSSPSIPDENINFDMVYALHTFVATVEGQATVYKGDALTLLDDSNSYWWLVSVIKTSEVGYIPAENIETPFERLARLNKHRNTDLTSLDQATHYINKEEKKKTIKKRRVTVSKDLSVQAQIILIGDDEEEEVGEAYEEWQEDMQDDCSEASDIEESDNETDAPQDIIEPCSPVKQSPTSSPVSQQQQQPERSIQPQPSQSLQQPSSQQQQPSPIVQPKPSLSYNGTPSSPRIDDKRSSTFWNIFARGKKEPTKSIPPNASNEDTDGRSISSVSSSILMDDKTPRAANGQAQLKVLRVFAGNINVGAMYHSMLVDDNTSAEQLLIQAMERFHIAQIENKTAGRTSRAITPTNGSGVEYYLTVKSMNGDEIIMAPQDKPLAIFQTLTTHLTTPMPSLTHVKQLSQQETPRPVSQQQQQQQQQQSRPAVGFYLHKRIRRINEREGQVYIKVSHYTNTTNSKDNNRSSTFSKNLRKKKKDTAHERIDKLIAVSASATIAELTTIALDKFHMDHHNEHDRYRMTVSTQPDKLLNPSNRLIEILHDDTPREAGEKVFILRKTSTQPTSRSAASLPPRSITSKVSPEKISRLKRPPLSIPQLDTKTKDIVRRVDTVLKTCSKDKKLGISNTSSGIAVSRNLDAGVDVILIHGTLRTRPLPKNQIEYALMTNNSIVVARKVIHQPSKQLFSANLKNVTEQDLDILVRYATAHLDVHDQKSGRKPVSSLNGSLSLDLLDSSSDQVSSLGDLEKEFQRIIASHTF